MNKKDLLVLSNLRQNARETLTRMSRKTGIPVSTLFDKIRLRMNGIIMKHTCLIDFNKLGYQTRANILIRVKKEQRDKLRDYIVKENSINSAYKVNNGYDVLLEGIFKDIKEIEVFFDKLDKDFDIEAKEVYYVINDIKKEDFLSKPDIIKFLSENN
jgi:DNA-binding Lrp family transcriptional regulator